MSASLLAAAFSAGPERAEMNSGGVAVSLRVGWATARNSCKMTCAFVPPKPKELTPTKAGDVRWSSFIGRRTTSILRPVKIDFRIWLLAVEARWDFMMLQHQQTLDQACHARRWFEMTYIGFRRADREWAAFRALDAERATDRTGFRRIAGGRPGAVCLEVDEIFGIDLGLGIDRRSRASCAALDGRAIPWVWPSLLIPMPRITARIGSPSRRGIRQRLQDHDAAALGAHIALRQLVEGPAPPVGGSACRRGRTQ